MLNKDKARALLTPAFADPKLARLLMLAISHTAQHYEREESKTLAQDYNALFEVAEGLRAEQAPPRE